MRDLSIGTISLIRSVSMKAPPASFFRVSLDSRTLGHLPQWLRSRRKQIWVGEMSLETAQKFSWM
jgi:hypothetical protein